MPHVKLRPDKDMLVHKVKTNGITLLVVEPRARNAKAPSCYGYTGVGISAD